MTLIRTSPSGPNIEVDAPVDLGPFTIYGNPTAAPGPGVDIALGPNTVLGRVGGNIVAAQLVSAQIALNQVTNAILAQGAALSVKANPTGAVADFLDLQATVDDTVLRRVGGALSFGQLTPGMIPAAIFPLSSIEPIAPNTVVANATAGAASPTAVAVGTNSVLGRVAGNIVAAQIVTAQIGLNQVDNTVLAQMNAHTVKVNATGSPADPQDLAVGMNSVIGRIGGNIIAAQLVTAQIAVNQVDNTILAKMAANTVKVNATALLADPQDLAVGTNTVLGRVGANLVAAQLVTAQIALNQVTNAVLAQMAALTVKANATAALADPQDVAASSNDTVLRRTGNTLNFGQLTPGMIPSAIIPLSAIEPLAANTVVANATAGLASPTAVAIGFNTVLGRVAGNIVAAQLVTAQIALNQVTNAVLAQMAANTVKVNATAALADAQDLAVGTNTVLGRVAGNIVAAQIVTAQIATNQVTNAVLAQMAALTVKANPTNALANAQDLAASSDDTLLRRTSSTLSFGQLTAGMIPAAIIPLTALAAQAANTVVANATAGSASPTAVSVGTNTVLGRVAGNIVAAQLVTAQIALNQVTNAVLAQMAANTVKVNATAALADAQDLAVGTNTVLGRVAGNIVAAQIVTAQIATNQVTNAVLAQMAALTVKANPTNALANAQDIAASSDDTLLRRTGATLNFGQLTAGMIPGGLIPLSALAAQAADTVVANVTSGSASPTAVLLSSLVSALTSLAYDATNHRFAYIGSTSQVSAAPSGAVGVLNISTLESGGQVLLSPSADANIDGFTAKAAGFWFDLIYTTTTSFTVTLNNGVGTTTSIQCAGNVSTSFSTRALLRLRYNGSTWSVGAADSWSASLALGIRSGAFNPTIDAGQYLGFGVAPPTLGLSERIRSDGDLFAYTNGAWATIAATSISYNTVNGSITFAASGALGTVTIQAVGGAITLTTPTNASGFVSINSWLRMTAQAASTPVLTTGQGLFWVQSGTPTQPLFTDSSNTDRRLATVPVPNADLDPMAANTVKANATAGSATPTDVSVGTNTVLGRVAGNIVAAQIVTAQIALNQVTNAVLAQMAANTVKVNATAALADPTDLAVGTNTVLGRVAGNIVAAQLVNAQYLGGAVGTVKGVAIDGTPGVTQDLTGTEQGENIRYSTFQLGPSGTNLDIVLLQDTTVLYFTTNNNTIRSLSSLGAIDAGREVRVELLFNGGVLGFVNGGVVVAPQYPLALPNLENTNVGDVGFLTLRFEGGQWRASAWSSGLFNAVHDGLVPASGGGTTNFLRADRAWTTVGPGSITPIAANTVLANATAGSAAPTAVSVGTNTVLGRVAGNIVAAQVVNAQVTGGALGTVKGVALGGVAGVLQDLTGALLGQLVRWTGLEVQSIAAGTVTVTVAAATTWLFINTTGNVVIDAIVRTGGNGGSLLNIIKNNTDAGTITLRYNVASGGNLIHTPSDTDVVWYGIWAGGLLMHNGFEWFCADTNTLPANSVMANATTANGAATALSVGTNTVLGRVAGNIVAAQLVTAQITDKNVTYAKIQDVQALSILARVVNSDGVVSALHSPGPFAVPYDDGAGSLIMNTLVTGNYGNATVTLPKLATQAANTIVANATAGVASPTAVAVGTNTVVGRVAGNIVAAQIVTAQIAVNQVTNAVLAQMAANTVKVNATAATADPTDLAVATNTVVGRVSGNIVAAGLSPLQLAGISASISVPFYIGPILFTNTGAGANDTVVYNANAPRGFRIVGFMPIISAGNAGTIQLRNATGGGGSALSAAYDTTVASDAPAITASLGSTQTVAANGTVVARRTNGVTAGEFFILCLPL